MLKRLSAIAVMGAAVFFSVSCFSSDPSGAGEKHDSTDVVKYDKEATIAYWQTYSQSSLGGVHKFVEGEHSFVVEKLPSPAETFHTGYAFVHDGTLYFEDRGNYIQYQPIGEGRYKQVTIPLVDHYRSSIYEFSFDYKTSMLSACLQSDSAKCESISLKTGTFPYVYASKGDAVISISNYGDALLFKGGQWCRMSMLNDVYSCAVPEAEPLLKPREIQFYSSVSYQGKVLIGEWPTGRLYEFDGAKLKPSEMTPPKFAEQAKDKMGYEAQTMAEYCGDLFVGYWPKGEVWRYDHLTQKWNLFKRFFSEEKNESFIPYANREPDSLDSAFFGQRVTALVPFEDSLYVTTSNLRSWKSSDVVPKTIDPAKVSEYGTIYKVTRQGCTSTYDRVSQAAN